MVLGSCLPFEKVAADFSTLPAKTAALFVHGAWHGPECFSEVRRQLAEQGIESVAVDLPSCHSRPGSFQEDVAAVQNEIILLADQGADVVLVLHSYGGRVGTPAVQEGATELIDPAEHFYHDLPTDQQKYWASKLRPLGLAFKVVNAAAWLIIDSKNLR
ncbi:hypothetical protein WJX73_010897 [Symbiochloris irregularis]|uniref:AB hydrolase-1 domain-containing protein n=1 Tax=Symbiochloris irregularis TaxID=706552 RepID=A0AAW1P680_9CHLO